MTPFYRKLTFSAVFAFSTILSACLMKNTQSDTQAAQNLRAQKWTLAVFGDSVTNGVRANTILGKETFELEDLTHMLTLLATGISAGDDPEGEGALNAKRMQRSDRFFGKPEFSAFLGSQEWSIPTRLRNAFPHRELKVIPLARSGMSYRQGYMQIDKLINDFSKTKGQNPNIAIINLGGIDFFISDYGEVFRKNVSSFYEKLFKQYKNIFLLVAPVPDLVTLMTLPDRTTLHIPKQPPLTCHGLWRQGGLGTKTGLIAPTTSEIIRTRRAQIEEMNQIIAEESVKAATRYGSFGKNQVKMLPPPFAAVSNKEWDTLLAFDCFHINVTGQKYIADKLWDVVFSTLKQFD
jgi:lysophospholipase L1-like esterase